MSRISPGTAIVGIFAVLFGLIGAYAIRKSLEPDPVAETPPPQTNNVPVASIDLEPGRPVTMGDIAILRLTDEQIRERELPEGYMTNPQQIIGRTLRQPLQQGETFMTAALYPQGMGPTVAERLEPGYRAVTVPIANTAAVSGMATPGSLVDVYFRTSEDTGENLPQTTITLLESVEVLALNDSLVEGTTVDGGRGVSTVTLAVSPEQAAALKVVENRGELMLAVRNPSDVDYVSDPVPQTLEGLLGFSQATPPLVTEIYRGQAKEMMSFETGRSRPPQITGLPIRPRTLPASSLINDSKTPGRQGSAGSETSRNPGNAVRPTASDPETTPRLTPTRGGNPPAAIDPPGATTPPVPSDASGAAAPRESDERAGAASTSSRREASNADTSEQAAWKPPQSEDFTAEVFFGTRKHQVNFVDGRRVRKPAAADDARQASAPQDPSLGSLVLEPTRTRRRP